MLQVFKKQGNRGVYGFLKFQYSFFKNEYSIYTKQILVFITLVIHFLSLAVGIGFSQLIFLQLLTKISMFAVL